MVYYNRDNFEVYKNPYETEQLVGMDLLLAKI